MGFKKYKVLLKILLGLGVVVFAFFVYQMLQNSPLSNGMLTLIMLIIGLILGGALVFLASGRLRPSPTIIKENSHTIAESMKKVFKVVSAEGHFNEIYNYEETSKLFNFIPTTKKALVIVQAKVLVGYDFEKLQWEIDESNKKIRLKDFPAPEILSTETDYKYYNIEEQFFNLFSKEDMAKIQQNSKKQVIEAAKKSHLPEVAAEQMKTLLTELLSGKNFTLENPSIISNSTKELEFKPEQLD